MINIIKTRDECLLNIKHLLPSNPVTCEIGFFRGEFSKLINDILEPSKHYTVDFFEGNGFSGDKDGNDIQCQNMSEMKILSEELGYNTITGTSEKLKDIDEKFDFIYIDADHTYNWVSFDLKNSYDKIKNGGIIAGHDYSDNQFPECVAAVNDFCKSNNQQIFLLSEDGCPSFFIKINKE
jgi:hypothetical protein